MKRLIIILSLLWGGYAQSQTTTVNNIKVKNRILLDDSSYLATPHRVFTEDTTSYTLGLSKLSEVDILTWQNVADSLSQEALFDTLQANIVNADSVIANDIYSSGNIESDTSFADVFTNKSDMAISESGSDLTINADTTKNNSILTSIDDYAGITMHSFQNTSSASASVVGTILQLKNDNGYWGAIGMTNSGSTILSSTLGNTYQNYNQGYGDFLYTNDGNVDFRWFSDPTDSHNFSALSNEIMTLSASGKLTVDSIDATVYEGLNTSNWDAAYSHSIDNSQAHSDYLINNGNDTTNGILTASAFRTSSSNVDYNLFVRNGGNYSMYVTQGDATGDIASFKYNTNQAAGGTQVMGINNTGVDIVGELTMTGNISVNTDDSYNLGSSSNGFNNVYGDTAHFNVYTNSDFVLGESGSDITVNADTNTFNGIVELNSSIAGDLIPGVDSAYDIGFYSGSDSLYISNTGTLNSFWNCQSPSDTIAQTFTILSSDKALSSIIVNLRKTLSPGNLVVRIQDTESDAPSINILGETILSESDIPTSSANVVITFPSPVILNASTKYCVTFNAPSSNISNSVSINALDANTYAGGQLYESDGGAAWSAKADDMYFILYSGNVRYKDLYLAGDITTPIIETDAANDWMEVNGTLRQDRIIHSFFYFEDSSVTITINTVNVWEHITNATNNLFIDVESDDMNISGDTIDIEYTGHYMFNWNFVINGGNSKNMEVRLYNITDGAGIPSKNAVTTRGSSNDGIGTISYDVNATALDKYIFQIRNTTDATDVDVIDGAVFGKEVHK